MNLLLKNTIPATHNSENQIYKKLPKRPAQCHSDYIFVSVYSLGDHLAL